MDAADFPFHYEARADLPVTVGLLTAPGAVYVAEALHSPFAPDRALSTPLPPLRGLDAAALEALERRPQARIEGARRASDGLLLGVGLAGPALGYVVEAGLAGTSDGRLADAGVAGARVGLSYEAVATSFLLTDLVKRSVGRPRPYLYAWADEPARLAEVATVSADGTTVEADAFASFFSGHTSTVAAASFATAHTWAWGAPRPGPARVLLPYGLAAGLTVTTGALRVTAGRHHPSDVIVGGIVGTAVGIAIPELHRLPVAVDTAASGDATVLRVGGTW